MSSSAYSQLIFGVPLKIEKEMVVKEFKRFDPKNGKQFSKEENICRIDITVGSKTFQLPDDDQIYSEDAPNYQGEDSWFFDRERMRILTWLAQYHIGLDDDKLGDKLIMSDHGNVVGVLIKSGCSYGYTPRYHQEFKLDESILNSIGEKISKTFNCGVVYPTFHLITYLA